LKDHKEFEDMLRPHVSPQLLTCPMSKVGEMIFKDGMVLTALAKLWSRRGKTPFLANYVFRHLEGCFEIEQNQFVFYDACNRAYASYDQHLEQ
jgi:hypothetical protein